MITEFTCGIFNAIYDGNCWSLVLNRRTIAFIHPDGILLQWTDIPLPFFNVDDLLEISILMNNIKRQYKELNAQIH